MYIYIYIYKTEPEKMMCLCCDINQTCLLRADRVECEWIIDVCCGYIYKVLKQKNKRVCVVCAVMKIEEIKSGLCCHACSESVCADGCVCRWVFKCKVLYMCCVLGKQVLCFHVKSVQL
jgi:hypothetical protein